MEANDISQLLKSCGFQEKHIETFLDRMNGEDLIPVINAAREKNIQYLDGMMRKYKILEWINELNPKNAIDQFLFISEGYNYHICLPNENIQNQILDWLDNRKIKYASKGPGDFAIKCENRRDLFGLDTKLNEMIGLNPIIETTILKPLTNENTIGDVVMYNGKKCSVKIPKGPHNTIGIVLNKKLKFVDRSEIS